MCAGVFLLAACSSVPTAQVATVQKPPVQSSPAITKTPAATITSTHIDETLPVHLSVPSIGINAPVEQVGILANGDLATPTRNPWIDAGWYSDGPLPGQRGSAVIDGHLDRPGGYPAVFWYLRDIHVGDAVYVTEKDGRQLRFHVIHLAYFTPQDAPLQDIFGNNSGTYLNLITCAGDWIPEQHQTTLRLVVYTMLG